MRFLNGQYSLIAEDSGRPRPEGEIAVARAFLLTLWLLHWLPLPILGRLGEAAGSLLFLLAGRRRRVSLINLRLCLPEVPTAQRRRLARQHFQAYARSILERGVLWWAPEARLRRLIRVEPRLPLQTLRQHPTILLCPHFVSLDVAGVAVAMATPGCAMYAPQSNPLFDHALRRGRSRFHPVALVERAQGIRPILRAMREGLPFFMCPDMDFGLRDSVFVPFFGVSAATLTASARIAGMTGARVIPVTATYLPNYQGWHVRFFPAWKNFPGPDPVAATRRMNQFIEQQIRQTPAEYFWVHRRFKTRPPGAPKVYAEGR